MEKGIYRMTNKETFRSAVNYNENWPYNSLLDWAEETAPEYNLYLRAFNGEAVYLEGSHNAVENSTRFVERYKRDWGGQCELRTNCDRVLLLPTKQQEAAALSYREAARREYAN
jgi:hypothetical protein